MEPSLNKVKQMNIKQNNQNNKYIMNLFYDYFLFPLNILYSIIAIILILHYYMNYYFHYLLDFTPVLDLFFLFFISYCCCCNAIFKRNVNTSNWKHSSMAYLKFFHISINLKFKSFPSYLYIVINYFYIKIFLNLSLGPVYTVVVAIVALRHATITVRPWPNDSIFHSIFSSTFDLKVERLA